MWESQFYTLQILTSLMSINMEFKWVDIEQKAFDQINHILDRNTLSAYPYFNNRFNIHTGVSDFQLVAVIIR